MTPSIAQEILPWMTPSIAQEILSWMTSSNCSRNSAMNDSIKPLKKFRYECHNQFAQEVLLWMIPSSRTRNSAMNVSIRLLKNDFFMSAKKPNQPAVTFTLFTSLFHKQHKKWILHLPSLQPSAGQHACFPWDGMDACLKLSEKKLVCILLAWAPWTSSRTSIPDMQPLATYPSHSAFTLRGFHLLENIVCNHPSWGPISNHTW